MKNLRLKRFWGPNLRLKEKRWENSKNIKFPYKSPPQAEIFEVFYVAFVDLPLEIVNLKICLIFQIRKT